MGERGVGLTQACGSAACAVVAAGARLNKVNRQAKISLPGGDLLIDGQEKDNHIYMTGPVELEHQGTLNLPIS